MKNDSIFKSQLYKSIKEFVSYWSQQWMFLFKHLIYSETILSFRYFILPINGITIKKYLGTFSVEMRANFNKCLCCNQLPFCKKINIFQLKFAWQLMQYSQRPFITILWAGESWSNKIKLTIPCKDM